MPCSPSDSWIERASLSKLEDLGPRFTGELAVVARAAGHEDVGLGAPAPLLANELVHRSAAHLQSPQHVEDPSISARQGRLS